MKINQIKHSAGGKGHVFNHVMKDELKIVTNTPGALR